MASSGKQKTTMAKLKREANLRDKRAAKAARKEIRRQPQPEHVPSEHLDPEAIWAETEIDSMHPVALEAESGAGL